jgi:hypothetical protein
MELNAEEEDPASVELEWQAWVAAHQVEYDQWRHDREGDDAGAGRAPSSSQDLNSWCPASARARVVGEGDRRHESAGDFRSRSRDRGDDCDESSQVACPKGTKRRREDRPDLDGVTARRARSYRRLAHPNGKGNSMNDQPTTKPAAPPAATSDPPVNKAAFILSFARTAKPKTIVAAARKAGWTLDPSYVSSVRSKSRPKPAQAAAKPPPAAAKPAKPPQPAAKPAHAAAKPAKPAQPAAKPAQRAQPAKPAQRAQPAKPAPESTSRPEGAEAEFIHLLRRIGTDRARVLIENYLHG